MTGRSPATSSFQIIFYEKNSAKKINSSLALYSEATEAYIIPWLKIQTKLENQNEIIKI
jgi:hypothetical protein